FQKKTLVLEFILDPSRFSFLCLLNISDYNPLLEFICFSQKNDPIYSKITSTLMCNDSYMNEIKSFDINMMFLSSHYDYVSAGHLGFQKKLVA
ncbi:hypothetical protein H8356DRAFT_1326783, partial [Neocallimastix lanati (nom. inval.)]